MNVFSKTDVGLVRQENQDAYFTKNIANNAVFAIVCDGMGGANAGNIASQNAAKHISEYIENSYRENMTTEDLEKVAKNAVISANIVLYDMSVSDPNLTGMGTTVVLAIVKENTAVIVHVGDSRIYLLNDEINQLTRDHSVVQSLIESGKITPEVAKVHPRKNIITRALGAEETVSVDTAVLELKDGDSLLLCTDGLTNYLDDNEILNIFKNNDIANIPQMLVESANANGGGDNITVAILAK